MPMIYLSPSTQEWNEYVTGSGSEEYNMNLLADALEPYLRSNGIQYRRNRPEMTAASSIREANLGQYGAVDKVTFILVLTNKKDAHRRHPACFIIRFRFNAVADKRQWSSAASKPRRKTRAKLCSRFCAENEPSHQTCRSFSASR